MAAGDEACRTICLCSLRPCHKEADTVVSGVRGFRVLLYTWAGSIMDVVVSMKRLVEALPWPDGEGNGVVDLWRGDIEVISIAVPWVGFCGEELLADCLVELVTNDVECERP